MEDFVISRVELSDSYTTKAMFSAAMLTFLYEPIYFSDVSDYF
jgi:hypothetical protein